MSWREFGGFAEIGLDEAEDARARRVVWTLFAGGGECDSSGLDEEY